MKPAENGTAKTLASKGNYGTSGPVEKMSGCLKTVSDKITAVLEKAFDKLGQSIGRRPWTYIVGSLVIAGLCGLGMVRFRQVTDPNRLWVPSDAQVLRELEWISTSFPSSVRVGLLIVVADNVLSPSALSAMLDIYLDIYNKNSSGIQLTDVCIKAGPRTCIVNSVLELWSYNSTIIRTLTQDQIISDLNSISKSPMYSSNIDLATLLGERTTDKDGNVTKASAALMTFLLQGADDIQDKTAKWEQLFLDTGKKGHADLTDTFVFAVRSFGDEAGRAIKSDVVSLSIGYFLVIFFVMLVLGKFNLMEQKIWLSLAGIVAVGLAILVSFGLSSAFGFDYGPLQSVLPFLLLGVGVDDMFVIMGALANLEPEEQQYDLPRKMGDILRHAGISVTVTSITDFVAFGVGATTVLPSLQSFCVYAALGILALYLLQAVFFTACLCLDLRRMTARRDACCCCYTHPPSYQPNACSQRELIPLFFQRIVEPALSTLPVKVMVMVTTATLLAVNVWGFVKLEQYFDNNWFLPTDSYAFQFTQAQARYFPDDGADGAVYCGNIDYFGSRTKFASLYEKFVQSPYIYNGTTDSWFQSLTDWLATTTDPTVLSLVDNVTKYPMSESAFVNLTHTLTRLQARHASNIRFSQPDGGDITAARIVYQHVAVSKTVDQLAAVDAARQMVKDAGFSPSQCFAFSRVYLSWETNRVIQDELYRNLGLAAGCVLIVTVILIAHVGTSLLVFCCVIFTLVDVAGSMHFWGLTIDTVTTIILILAIGLAVDYSAHIGHMFMTVTGTRAERVKETLGEMGPPVFYGGFSTFLAFVLLAGSNSYVFTTFFKVFLLVVLYGLFHGLLFLPVVLSWVGPQPYSTADRHYHPHLPQHHPDVQLAQIESPPITTNYHPASHSQMDEHPTMTGNKDMSTVDGHL